MIFDDGNSIVYNPSIKRLWPLVGDAETPGPLNPGQDFCTSGRPLVNLSLAVNYRFSRRYDPTGYHIFNAVLHTVNAVLLYAIVRRTLRLDYFQGRFASAAGPLALIAALIWAVHPLQVDAVQYITQRTELMVSFFYLATLGASLHYWAADSRAGRAAWLLAATLAGLGGAASKEVMASAPAMVLLFERTFIAGSFVKALRSSWPLYVGLSLTWGLLFALNVGGPRSETAGFHVDLAPYAWWLTQCKVLCIYLRLAVWPWPLVIHYEFPFLDSLAVAWPWLLAVTALAVVTVVLVWRRTAAGFVLTWVVAILSPTLVVPIITEIAAERRMYLPLAALVTLAVAGGYALIARWLQRPGARSTGQQSAGRPLLIICAVGIVAAVIYGSVSARHLRLYNEPLQLWQDALKYQPGSSISQFNVGITLSTMGRVQEAIPHYEEAIRIKPRDGGTHNNLGFALLLVGRINEALGHIEKAIELKPESAEAHNNMGLALAHVGQTDEALAQFEQAMELRPEYADATVNSGVLLSRLGQPQAAVARLREALNWEPDHLDGLTALVNAYLELGQTAEAVAAARAGLQAARAQGRPDQVAQFASFLKDHSAVQPTRPGM